MTVKEFRKWLNKWDHDLTIDIDRVQLMLIGTILNYEKSQKNKRKRKRALERSKKEQTK